MLLEDVLDFDNIFAIEGCALERRHRALREARAHHATTSRSISRKADHRGRRALRKTHPAARSIHPVAPRARHLRYNHFTRPPRRRKLHECSSKELLDGLYIKGGWDGTQIFVKLELDVSKDAIDNLREVIMKPLGLLSETNFLQELDLVSGGASIVDSVFDNIEADISFSAGAHMGATGMCMHFDSIATEHTTHIYLHVLL